MVKLKVFLLLLMNAHFSFGQAPFFSVYSFDGTDKGEDVIELSDGSFVVIGSSNSLNSAENQMYMSRLNSNGSIQWISDFGGSEIELGKRVLALNNQLYFFGTSNTNILGDFNFQMLKGNLDGVLSDPVQFGTANWEFLNDALLLPDSNFLLTGSTDNSVDGKKDAYALIVDTLGNSVFTFQSNLLGEDEINSVALLSDTAIVFTGTRFDVDSNFNVGFVTLLTLAGDTIWDKEFGSSYAHELKKVISTEHGIYAVGDYLSPQDTLFHEYYLRLNTQGSILKEVEGFDIGQRRIKDICYLGNSIYYIVSNSSDQYSQPIGSDIFYFRFNENFDFNFSAVAMNATGNDEHGNMHRTADGGFVAAGFTTQYGAGSIGLFVLKVGPNADYPNMQNPSIYTMLSINENQMNDLAAELFPNPTTGQVYAKFEKVEKRTFALYNSLGALCQKGELNQMENTLDFSGLEKGLYFLEIQQSGQQWKGKIIKQ